jgi:toxin CcdB
MSQFDIHENANTNTNEHYPYLLEVQSDIFADSSRAVYVPLVLSKSLKKPDKTFNPKFVVSGHDVRMFPLDIASAPRTQVGKIMTNVKNESDKVVAALDLLFARY